MVTAREVIPLLLEVVPSFRPTWEDFLTYWRKNDYGSDVPSAPPLYLATADLARHLIGMLRRGESDELAAVFGVVERLLKDGDEEARNLVCVGLLEDLQNAGLHRRDQDAATTQPEDFRAYLQPRSLECWEYLYAFWSNVPSGSLPDAVRHEARRRQP
ncbi:MAG TPA: hypothetical protein VJB57_19495 [Dehalococcoidia bacterium]|nr:hypothetical protein [Dehalococcoidia bacterium]